MKLKGNQCRICSVKFLQGITIFTPYKNRHNLLQIVHDLTSLEIKLDDNLPKSICELCANKLVEFNSFRQVIINSEDRLLEKRAAFEKVRQQSVGKKGEPNELERKQEKLSKNNQKASSGRKTSNRDFDGIASETANEKISSIKKKYKCEICERRFRVPSRFISHFRTVHIKQFERKKCSLCPRSFSEGSNLRRHVRNVHEGQMKSEQKTIMCSDCGLYFGGALEMYEHSKVHETWLVERPDGFNLVCEYCNLDLGCYDNYVFHMEDIHRVKSIKPVRCRWCGERCRSLQGLYSHIRLAHKCENTNLKTVATSAMINKTNGDKNSTFLCRICGKILNTKCNYKQHMNSHNEVIFRCNTCPAKFNNNLFLANHKKNHSSDKVKCLEGEA